MEGEEEVNVGFMRKVVFSQGKAPDGTEAKWKLREYRLNPDFSLLKNPHYSKEFLVSMKPADLIRHHLFKNCS